MWTIAWVGGATLSLIAIMARLDAIEKRIDKLEGMADRPSAVHERGGK